MSAADMGLCVSNIWRDSVGFAPSKGNDGFNAAEAAEDGEPTVKPQSVAATWRDSLGESLVKVLVFVWNVHS